MYNIYNAIRNTSSKNLKKTIIQQCFNIIKFNFLIL